MKSLNFGNPRKLVPQKKVPNYFNKIWSSHVKSYKNFWQIASERQAVLSKKNQWLESLKKIY